MSDRRSHQFRWRLDLAKVRGVHERLTAGLPNICGDFIESVGVARSQYDLRSVSSEDARDSTSDSAACAGYNGDFIC